MNQRLALVMLALLPPFAALEQRAHGRLGVYAVDLRTGSTVAYRADERFPLLSTFKLPLVVATLARVDAGTERLDHRLAIPTHDLLPNSPIVAQHAAAGDHDMTVRDLCMAAIRYSDNTAANVLLAPLGGPPALTAWMRSLGDTVFRLDRTEVALNESRVGDDRDTSTPRAMAAFVRRLVDRTILSDSARAIVLEWLRTNTSGDARLRAGVPPGWTVSDKIGTTRVGANDIGILTAPDGRTIVVAAYLTQSDAESAVKDSVLADVARAIVASR